MPSSPLRRRLRAAGHHLEPIVQVGKEGVSAAVLRQLDDALAHHELVKVKIGSEAPEDRFEAAASLAAGTGAQLAQILGRTALAYRKHPEKPRYEQPARKAASPPKDRSDRPAPRGRRRAR